MFYGDIMLEKSGEVILTDEDVKKSKEGVVTQRIKENWGFTLDELTKIVENNNYIITNVK